MQSWRGNQQLYARVERLVRQSSGRTKGAEPPSGRDAMMAASLGAGGEDGGGEPMGSQESRPLEDELDKAADGDGPGALSRAAYARKVFVASKTGYLTKKSGTAQGGAKNGGIGKIKFMNYVAKKRFFVLTGESLMYHHDHKNLDDQLNSKEIILDENSVISFSNEPSLGFAIVLIADGKMTLLGAKDEVERREWKEAIQGSIGKLKGTTRGYLMKLRAGTPTPASAPMHQAPLGAAVTSGDFKHVPQHHVPDTLLEGKDGAGEWCRKYFIVDGGSLTFHASHSSTLIVQGEFALPHTSRVEVRPGLLVVIRNDSDTMVCMADKEADVTRWVDAINGAIKENAHKRQLIIEARAARGEDPLASTFDLQNFVTSVTASASENSSNGGLANDGGDARVKTPRQGVTEGDAVRSPGGGFESRPHGRSFSGGEREVGGGALLKGDLATRPKSGDGPWKAAHYVLEKGRLLVFVDRHHVKPKQVHKISPSCSVFETNLKAFSFEVVVAGLVLHLQGSSFEDSLRWIATLKAAINNSPPDQTDPLLSEALRLEDTFYYADFETKQPLGVVLERSKEWAIVKLANPELSQVSVGSALASVNGESVVLKAYEETIAMLTGWKPPLNLIFRRAPVKEGWLKKAGVGKKASKWKNVWVDLREGKLSWFKLGPGGTLLGAMPMIGSAVALDPETESGAPNCLSVVAGVMSVVLQALNRQDALSWASHLYQASAVANGGGYLLDQERDQEVAYEEERRRRLAQEALERERFARSKRNSPQRPRSQVEEEQKEEGQPQQPQQQQPQQEGEDGHPAADGAPVPAAGSDDVVLEDKEAVAAAAGGAAEAETATATVSAESTAAGPLGFSTTDPTAAAAAAAAAAAPAVDDSASAARDGDEQQRSLDGDNADDVVVVARDPAASAGDNDGDGSEKDDADESPSSPTASAATAGRPELTVEVGDVVNGGTSAAAAAASGGAAAALSAPSEESTIGDLGGGRRPSGSVGGRPTFERKSSSVMDLIREREKAAQAARLPPSARKETSATHSPSLAAALTRGKVGAKPWLGASDNNNTPAAAAPTAASTSRWGSSMFSSSTPKASAATAAASGFSSTAPAVASTGGDDATAGEEEEEEQDKVASLAAAEASAGADGRGGGEKAMSPSMAAARMRKTVDRSVWSSAPSSSGAGSGPGLSATWTFNPAAGKQQKSSDESAQDSGPAEETVDGASGAPAPAVADCPPPAGFAAAKAMFASTGGIRAISRPTATSAVAAADVLAAAKAERESSEAAAAAAGAVSSSSVRQEVVVPASPAGFAAAKALFASTGGIPSGSKASMPPPSKPRSSTGAAAAAYARAAATSNSNSTPAPREPVPRATTKPWEKKTATADGGGGGGASGASWGSAAAPASAAAVTTTDSSSSSDDDGEPSSSAGGGRSLSPVTTPGAGGAAAKGSTSRHHQKSSEPRASPAVVAAAAEPSLSSSSVFGSTGGSVKAMSRDIFGSSSSGFKRPPTGGVALAGFGLTAPAAPREVPEVAAPPLESRPIGGPWDEEEVLKWVRDVTKLDIDPECGVAYSLKDGVALCRLMSKLQPGAPITAPSDSSLAYKQMANICIFLRSCRALGLGESILFETADLHEEKDIPNVVKTLVALGEHVPRSCPAFKGPHLNMSKFAWSTVLAQPSSTSGGGSGKASSLRASTGGISGRGGGGVSGSWPRRAGSSGGNSNVGAVWRRAVGSDHPASSGDEGSSEDDDDSDYESDEEGEEYNDEDEAVGSGSAAAANGGSRAAEATGGGARDGEMTDEMLSKAYDSVEAASQSGGLSPIQFSSLWRSLSGDRQNLFAEMKMFHKFNTSGDSVVNFEEFKAGFRLIAQENAKEHEQVLKNLKDWTDSQPAAF